MRARPGIAERRMQTQQRVSDSGHCERKEQSVNARRRYHGASRPAGDRPHHEEHPRPSTTALMRSREANLVLRKGSRPVDRERAHGLSPVSGGAKAGWRMALME